MDHRARLHAAGFRQPANRGLGCRRVERAKTAERLRERIEMRDGLRARQVLLHRRRVVLDVVREEGAGLVREIAEPARAWLQQVQHAVEPGALAAGQAVVPESGLAQHALQTRQQVVVRQAHDVLAVEPLQLLGVEHGVAAADTLQREARHQLVHREDFFVAAAR